MIQPWICVPVHCAKHQLGFINLPNIYLIMMTIMMTLTMTMKMMTTSSLPKTASRPGQFRICPGAEYSCVAFTFGRELHMKGFLVCNIPIFYMAKLGRWLFVTEMLTSSCETIGKVLQENGLKGLAHLFGPREVGLLGHSRSYAGALLLILCLAIRNPSGGRVELWEQYSNTLLTMTGEEEVTALIMCSPGCGIKCLLQPGICANLWSIFI